MLSVSIEDFAYSLGITLDDIPVRCKELIGKTDFRYEILRGAKRDKVILEVLKKIETDTKRAGAPGRRNVWEKGWSENLYGFVKSGFELSELIPKFFRPGQVIRLNRKYIKPSNPNFELDYFLIFRLWLFSKYFKDFEHIYEFGCGTGFNLVQLAQMYPQKKLYGLDFVPASIELVNKLAGVYGWNIKGQLFDMRQPDYKFKINENSIIFTCVSIEQLASDFEKFLQFILKNTPELCVHIEPTIELYDENDIMDYLAIKFHRKRGYTENYLTRLRELEAQGKLEILKVKRLFFGSLYTEGYSVIVWKPRKV